MSVKSMSYAEHINSAIVMAAGLNANLEKLRKRGINEAFINSLNESMANAISKNNEQEKLKADLKTCTSELNDFMNHLEKVMREAHKVVKLEIPQSQWKEYGIADKR